MVSVDALVDLTGASPITIRRDLADLEGQGLLRRVHGGAVQAAKRGMPTPYAARMAEDAEAKEALAVVVASLIPDDTSVVFDSGTTLVAAAHALQGRHLTALCLSLHAATVLGGSSAAQVLVPGGVIEPDSLSPRAPAAIAALNDFRADIALLGACSASPASGLTTSTWEDAQIKRAVVGCAARRILVVTASKLQRTSSFRFADVDDLDDLVITADAPGDLLEEFRTAGVRVHLADAARH